MSTHAKSIAIVVVMTIGFLNSIVALLGVEGERADLSRLREAALERIRAVEDWAELERRGWIVWLP